MKKCRGVALLLVALLVIGSGMPAGAVVSAAAAQEEEPTEKKKKRKGLRKGAASGAVIGLALGAVAGEAAAGAAVGAAVGGASGAWYDYDQDRQDDRTQMLADGLAGRPSAQAAPPATTGEAAPPAQETVGDVGKRHLKDLLGEWTVEIWGLDEEGNRLTANGKARGIQADENSTRILYTEIHIQGYDETLGGGSSLMRYEPGQGFFLENDFSMNEEKLKFVGEYMADKGVYNYYLMGGEGSMVGGIMRSSVRVEVRIASPSLWFADTYTHIDGKEVQVQGYRFMRS